MLASGVAALFATATVGMTTGVAHAARSAEGTGCAGHALSLAPETKPETKPETEPETKAADEPGAKADAPAEGAPGGEAPDAGAAPASDADAKVLYDEGQALYSAADYPGAVVKFTEALKLISRAGSTYPPDARGRLLYNLATAHDRTYNVDPDMVHLRKAIEVLQRIIDEAPVHGYEAALVDQARDELQRVRERLEEAESEANPPPPVEEPVTPAATTGDADESNPNAGKALIISGAVIAGVGLACSGIWIAGIVQGGNAEDDVLATTLPSQEEDRKDAVERGERANTLAAAGAVISSVLVVTGVALVVVGVLQRKKAKRVALIPGGPASAGRLAPSPGLSMQVRF